MKFDFSILKENSRIAGRNSSILELFYDSFAGEIINIYNYTFYLNRVNGF